MKITLAAMMMTSSLAMQLSNDEHAELASELQQWKQSAAGKAAIAQGLAKLAKPIRNQEGADVLEDELVRFVASKKVVEQLNRNHPEAAFSYDNQFALLTEADFSAYVKGSDTRGQPERRLRADIIARGLTAEQREAGGIDWSQDNAVQVCWTFSSVAVAEQAHCLVTGNLLDLSEQQLVSCDSSSGQGCEGGWPWKAPDYQYLHRNYPYTSGSTRQTGQCKTSRKKNKLSFGATVEIQGESALQSALDNQAYYKSGFVNSCPGAESDHAVLAVGYGNLNGVNHFKIRNSWGASWGGFIYLKRGGSGNGLCNVAEHPSYPTINVNPQPTSVSPTPTPNSPSPSIDSPAPTTKQPVQCNGCTQCYYPSGNLCFDFASSTCQSLSYLFDTILCGNQVVYYIIMF
ncbi:cysteine protease family C01A [Thraustotheca clavata]|uniref:Cysteine protease family C01A n=1 Tax=Thraustotheca clavata TaxID=74557 RepID=A0A1W0A0T1_9STRA|nr:cysteine protease family C01A [Thraustotheca clavata]